MPTKPTKKDLETPQIVRIDWTHGPPDAAVRPRVTHLTFPVVVGDAVIAITVPLDADLVLPGDQAVALDAYIQAHPLVDRYTWRPLKDAPPPPPEPEAAPPASTPPPLPPSDAGAPAA